jgi:hypothetical protein
MRRDALGKAPGDLALGGGGPILDTVGIDEVDGVALAAEGTASRRDVVGEDPVAALFRPLRLCIFDDVLGLGGAPSPASAAAMAWPCLPEERLAM